MSKTVLIVSPHFPPINAPDMHRVRMSLPYFDELGWKPIILAVEPECVDGVEEELLLNTIPSDVIIHRVRALPVSWTRKMGVRNIGLRALPYLYKAGVELIKKYNIDLIYFSTTMFFVMPLGLLWKKRFAVPYIIDLQDPWVGNYYDDKPKSERPNKYWLSHFIHKQLEPWTMQKVDGIVAVSEAYHETLREKYSCISKELCRTIPFGGSNLDFKVAEKCKVGNQFFNHGDGLFHGVYAGVLGKVMRKTCQALCLALKIGLEQYPDLFSKIRVHFIGTDYSLEKTAGGTIRPIAEEMDLLEFIYEYPERQPYLGVLNVLSEADFLLVVGSDNPKYTASKIYPYILAQRPMLAVFHEKSSVVEILKNTQAGEILTFSSNSNVSELATDLVPKLEKFLRRLPYRPSTVWKEFEPYTAREMTRKQCELFDQVIHTKKLAEPGHH